ncbi:hypothetical protein B7494_g2758 [Chlorociboria aeruginascens]|nr:hypothetical protein B7494_g2758 [Chlorociboria aeruginascens]
MPRKFLQVLSVGTLIELSLDWLSTGPYPYDPSENIINHSIGADKKLCEGISDVSKAVPADIATGMDDILDMLMSVESTLASRSTRIDGLQRENAMLKQQLKQWKDQAAAESEHRQQLEHDLNGLTFTNQMLQLDLRKGRMERWARSTFTENSGELEFVLGLQCKVTLDV